MDQTVRERPFCVGCGTYFAVNGFHRQDCTKVKKGKQNERVR